MAFAAEAHAVSNGNGLCAVVRGAEHADGFLTRLDVKAVAAVHVHIVIWLGLAQLRSQVGLLVARRRVGRLSRGGDLYRRTRHCVVGDAEVRMRGLGEQDDTRAVGVVGEEDVVAVELVGDGELCEGIGRLLRVAD